MLHIKNAAYAEDMSPLDPDCDCKVCKTYTRAMLHNIFRDEVGMRYGDDDVGGICHDQIDYLS